VSWCLVFKFVFLVGVHSFFSYVIGLESGFLIYSLKLSYNLLSVIYLSNYISRRLKGGGSEHNLEELVRKIDVPCGFLEQLKIGQRNEKLSESVLQSDQALIGQS
jgi:hypothetical protein